MFNILLLTDEKFSSLNQARALANELIYTSKNTILIEHEYVKESGLNILPNFIIYYYLLCKSFFFKHFFVRKVDLIISCGRKSAPYSLIIKKFSRCFSFHILNPYFQSYKFDKIIIPEHDKKSLKKNFVYSLGTLVDKSKLNIPKKDKVRFARLFKIKKIIISVLIGGSGKSSNLRLDDLSSILSMLKKLDSTFEVLYFFSRRTPEKLKSYILNKKKRNQKFFPSNGLNPYWYALKNSDYIFVTEDSVSMTCDAMQTRKPIFTIPVKKLKKKIKKFHDSLRHLGITKRFNKRLFSWKYNKIDESRRISNELRKNLPI